MVTCIWHITGIIGISIRVLIGLDVTASLNKLEYHCSVYWDV
jgi:hypothetical protein